MIFDIRLGKSFRRKAQLVGGGHTTTAPSSITFLLVVSRYSVRMALTITSLHNLDILTFNIQNAYLTALCRENIWTFAGPECGEEEGTLMLVKMALYGLKSSGAALQYKAERILRDIG